MLDRLAIMKVIEGLETGGTNAGDRNQHQQGRRLVCSVKQIHYSEHKVTLCQSPSLLV